MELLLDFTLCGQINLHLQVLWNWLSTHWTFGILYDFYTIEAETMFAWELDWFNHYHHTYWTVFVYLFGAWWWLYPYSLRWSLIFDNFLRFDLFVFWSFLILSVILFPLVLLILEAFQKKISFWNDLSLLFRWWFWVLRYHR